MHNLKIKIEGEGFPLLFLHGFLEDLRMWEYLPTSDMEFKKIFIDLPGHGGSSTPIGVPSIARIAEIIIEQLKELGIEKFHVIGHSMGGYVALELASMGFVEKLVLLNSNFWEDSIQKKKDRDRVVNIVQKSKDLFIQEGIKGLFVFPENYENEINTLVSWAKVIPIEGIVYATHAMKNRVNHLQICTELGEKLLVIQGEKDQSTPQSSMLELLPSVNQLYIIPEVGHMSYIESPKLVLQKLTDFFSDN